MGFCWNHKSCEDYTLAGFVYSTGKAEESGGFVMRCRKTNQSVTLVRPAVRVRHYHLRF